MVAYLKRHQAHTMCKRSAGHSVTPADIDHLEIQELTDEDYDQVARIFRASFKEDTYPMEDLKTSWDYRSPPDSLGFFVGPHMIGFVLASFHKKNGSNMYIDYIALDTSYRGMGLGSRLMSRLIEKCYKEGGSIHLYPERGSLHAWYERFGFYKTAKNYFVFHSHGTRRQRVAHTALGLEPSAQMVRPQQTVSQWPCIDHMG